jgi:hypothetical protein
MSDEHDNQGENTMGVKSLLLACCVMLPQAPGPADDAVTRAVRDGFDGVSGYILKAAELVPADKYSYQPTKDVRTFGQMLAHIVDGYNYFCAAGAGKKVEWSDATEKGASDKATLTLKLKEATSACQATYSGKGQLPELIKNNEHSNLHYGNLVTYLRLLGLKPPSS